MSAAAIMFAVDPPVGWRTGVWNVPSPLPRRSATTLLPQANAASSLPSRSKSPAATVALNVFEDVRVGLAGTTALKWIGLSAAATEIAQMSERQSARRDDIRTG